MKVTPAGDRGLLVELGDVTGEQLHDAARRAASLPRLLACIPGHSSLYLVFDGTPDPEEVREAVRSAAARGGAGLEEEDAAAGGEAAPDVRRIPVCFDGPDLPELLVRVSREELLERVAALRLTVRYLGFRGGFAYLDGWPEEWAMPRRPTSRPHVPRGAFAVAGSVAGFYPVDSPGGWNLLGRTSEQLEYALRAGDGIAIEPVDSLERATPAAPGRLARGDALVDVVSGPLVRRVEPADWSGIVHGIPPGGPFDEDAAALARHAVSAGGALYECAFAGPRIRAKRDCVVAWCDPALRVAIRTLRKGEEVSFGRIDAGLRGYLATGEQPGLRIEAARAGRLRIEVLAGPHETGIGIVECEVTPRLDRVGIRLRPLAPLPVSAPADLRSIGMQCGTIQLHPDGTLVAMGPDHPVTGGYLQPMTVLASERWKLAQLAPGDRVVFVPSVP